MSVTAHLRVIVAGTTTGLDGGSTPAPVETLVAQLRRRGHDAERVLLPLHADRSLLLAHACAWRMLNLSASNARHIDLVIATAFPAWCTRHPRKIAWIPLDDPLADGEQGGGPAPDADVEARTWHLRDLDARALAECRHVFAGGASTVERLKRRTGIEATLLPYAADVSGRDAGGSAGDPSPVWDSIIEQLLG